MDAREFAQVLLVHTRHHVEGEFVDACRHVDGAHGAFKTVRVAAEQVVVCFKPVEADGECAETRIQELGESFGRERETVGDHAPRVAAGLDVVAAFFEVGTHQGLASGNYHGEVGGVDMRSKPVEYLHEVFAGHVRDGIGDAVAAAVLAMQVAAQRAFPEEIR